MWQMIYAFFCAFFRQLAPESPVRRSRQNIQLVLSGFEERVVPAVINTPTFALGLTQVFNENVSASQPIDKYNITLSGQAQFTAQLTNMTANVNFYLRDASTNAIIASGTNSGTASESVGMTIVGTPGVNRPLRMEIVSVGGSSSGYGLTMNAAPGWSQVTGFRMATPGVRQALVAAMNSTTQGASSGQSVYSSSWITDFHGTDGQSVINAGTIYRAWRINNPTATIVPDDVRNNMNAALASYGNDRDLMRTQIISNYNARPLGYVIPTDRNVLLQFMNIRAQCYEFAMTKVQQVGGTIRTYDYGRTNALPTDQWRPGSILFFYNNAAKTSSYHTAVIVDIKWNANGVPIALKYVECNNGPGFSHPGGQIPWLRTIQKPPEVTLSANGTMIGNKYISVV